MSHTGPADPSARLLLEFLDWLAIRPRSYAEAMDAWRTSCPRLSVWEDALELNLIEIDAVSAAVQGQARVALTATGLARLSARALA